MNGTGNWRVLAAFATVYVVWGSTYFAIVIALQSIPPFLMSGSRFLLAGVLLHAWCLLNKQAAPTKESVRKNIIPAILILFGGTASVAWAEQYIPSSLVAIVVTIVPFWFVLLDKKQWAFYFSNKLIIAGLLVGFAGIIMLVGFQHEMPKASLSVTTGQQIAGILAVVAGGIAWARGSLYSKYNPASDSLLMNASLQMLIAGVFTTLVSVISGDAARFSFHKVSAGQWAALFYLAIVSSIITYLCYLYLLKMRPPAQVSTYVYVNPVIALLLGALFVGEKITGLQVVALLIILSGVLLVNLPKYKALLYSKLGREEKTVRPS